MPSMDAIINYWREHDGPWLKSRYIGWGEPFCFACGWLAPVADGRADSWRQAGKWLDKAHLHDHAAGGPDEPFNLVPLCHLCHDRMPESDSTMRGLLWVQNREDVEWGFQLWTDTLLRNRKNVTRLTTLMRVRVRYLEAVWAPPVSSPPWSSATAVPA